MEDETICRQIEGAILSIAGSDESNLSEVDLRDSVEVVRHPYNVTPFGEVSDRIDALNLEVGHLAGRNLFAACFLLDGLQILASEEMMHHVYDGAEFFFAELSEADLLKLVEYTSPGENETPSKGHLRWLDRLNQRRSEARQK